MNFGLALAQNHIPGVAVTFGTEDPQALVRSILEKEPGEQTKTAIEQGLSNVAGKPLQAEAMAAGLAIGSPEFQRR
jgi:hypothetical protein